ncbi:MAG: malto-oligosyltrehalose trehalohydrolase [Acidobacteriaceae bacterium]
MHRFSLWAPGAQSVSVKLEGILHAMSQSPSGWWSIELVDAEHGMHYAFVLNGEEASYPDPRSLWQPEGVHADSCLYDHARFVWTDSGWQAPPLASAIIYELHIGTFTHSGTLDEAIEHLDYLVELGVTHVELMPVAAFDGDYGWGYDGVALFAPHEPYGGPDALKRFVNACHAKGLAVLLDVVYNHFGPSGNYTGQFGPYLTGSHSTPWGGAVNLEGAGSDEVRRFYCDNALAWLRDYHLDGLRLDAVHAFVDRSAIHFLEQLAAEVETLSAQLGRSLVLIAESDLNDPRIVTPREASGYGMDAQWSDDFHHALFSVTTGEVQGYYQDFGSLKQLAKSVSDNFVYDGVYSPYRGRIHGRSAAHVSAHRFLGYIQNHDQVGNRALGERLYHLIGLERAKVAAAVVLMAPFVPMLFQGEEFAASAPFQYFADHREPQLARAVSEGRRKEFAAFGWKPEEIPDPEDPATFKRCKLDWDEARQGAYAEMLRWYRQLIQLRRSTPELNDGEPHHTAARFDEESQWLVMQRGAMQVICNFAKKKQLFPILQGSVLLLASTSDVHLTGSLLVLPPDAVAILRER